MENQDDQRAMRAAENQGLFRTVNERIKELKEAFDTFTQYGSWTCECAQMDCADRIEMTLGEYEALRARPDRFAVVRTRDHLEPDVERVVERTERYWVVEKIGVAGERAAELDARS